MPATDSHCTGFNIILYIMHRVMYITCCVCTHAQGVPSVGSDSSDCSDHHLCGHQSVQEKEKE